MAKILDGLALSKKIKAELNAEVDSMRENGCEIGLAVIIVGNNPASRVYVNHKKKDCAELGIVSEEYALGEDTTEEELLTLIDTLNVREDIHGILVQLPLPKQIDESKVIKAINPEKDVDAFHPENRPYRQKLCGYRQKQYRGQASGNAAPAQKCHCDNMPFKNS